jgi:hypothetical protein
MRPGDIERPFFRLPVRCQRVSEMIETLKK